MERASVAFGRYLRRLREQRALTLRRVCDLSEPSPYGIDKATLSRFERGQQRPTLSVLIPLGRIYHVPAEVLLERFELDMELDRIGGPETDGKSHVELQELGRHALIQRSAKWDAYGYLRDAAAGAEENATEQQAATARLNLATISRSLGKNRYALFELHELERNGELPGSMTAILLERISNCYRCLGDFELAEQYVGRAIAESLFAKDDRALAYAYFARASIALDRHDYAPGIELLTRAFRSDRAARNGASALPANESFGAHTLIKLSDAFFLSSSMEKAGRIGLAAKKLSTRYGNSGTLAYSEFALGQVDEATGRSERALQRWRRAADISESIHNTRLGFAAECAVFKQSIHHGNRALAAASRRRLERLAPWVPEHLPLLAEFRELACDGRSSSAGLSTQPGTTASRSEPARGAWRRHIPEGPR